MPTETSCGRRSVLASLGALSLVGAAMPAAAGAGAAAAAADGAGSPAATGKVGSLAPPSDFLLAPRLVYLQTASLGPTPRAVFDRTVSVWRQLETNPVYQAYFPLEEAMEQVRARAAAFLGCGTQELVLTRSTTDGMNQVAQGLGLGSGDRVLRSDQEHPGGRVCWDYLARKQGVGVDVVSIPPGENDAQAIVDRFAAAITPRTRVVSFSHLLTSTGLRMPVAELAALARRRGCLVVVDGAQAAGGVRVDVKALGCHVYVTSGHKWLLGPKGTGLLYLSDEIGNTVDPIALQAGRKAYCDSTGTTNIPGVLGLAAAIDYLEALGIDAIERHNLALASHAWQSLHRVPRIRIVSPPPGPLASPIVSYELPQEINSRELMVRMRERQQVVIKMVPTEWFNGNRVSTHVFNSAADVDACVEALSTEIATFG